MNFRKSIFASFILVALTLGVYGREGTSWSGNRQADGSKLAQPRYRAHLFLEVDMFHHATYKAEDSLPRWEIVLLAIGFILLAVLLGWLIWDAPVTDWNNLLYP